MRTFGCGTFIRVFLRSLGPFGSGGIDPYKGACQEYIFYQYKIAMHTAYAEDNVALEQEKHIKRGQALYTALEYAEKLKFALGADTL
ncbi:hypothetical protein ACFLXC_06010 [Chloroflexota bacterium]